MVVISDKLYNEMLLKCSLQRSPVRLTASGRLLGSTRCKAYASSLVEHECAGRQACLGSGMQLATGYTLQQVI